MDRTKNEANSSQVSDKIPVSWNEGNPDWQHGFLHIIPYIVDEIKITL